MEVNTNTAVQAYTITCKVRSDTIINNTTIITIFITVLIAPIAAVFATIKGIIDNHSYYDASIFFSDLIGTFALFYYAPWALRILIELLVIAGKYGFVILKYLFLPIIVIYNFLSYLANKCKYKAEKYEKNSKELNK